MTRNVRMMRALECDGPIRSEGMMEGELFCLEHGTANDVAYGWDERGCLFAHKLAKAVNRRDYKKIAKLLRLL